MFLGFCMNQTTYIYIYIHINNYFGCHHGFQKAAAEDILWSGLASYHFMASKLYFLLTLSGSTSAEEKPFVWMGWDTFCWMKPTHICSHSDSYILSITCSADPYFVMYLLHIRIYEYMMPAYMNIYIYTYIYIYMYTDRDMEIWLLHMVICATEASSSQGRRPYFAMRGSRPRWRPGYGGFSH